MPKHGNTHTHAHANAQTHTHSNSTIKTRILENPSFSNYTFLL